MSTVTVIDHSAEVEAALEGNIPAALTAAAMQAVNYAQLELENTPRRVDTGRLKNSITFEVMDKEAQIGSNVEYAGYVHEGTYKMEPNRFLKNALEKNADEIKAILNEYLQA